MALLKIRITGYYKHPDVWLPEDEIQLQLKKMDFLLWHRWFIFSLGEFEVFLMILEMLSEQKHVVLQLIQNILQMATIEVFILLITSDTSYLCDSLSVHII